MARHSVGEEAPIQAVTSREETLKELEEWAGRYEIVAALGYLALLLALGRSLNHIGKVAKFRFTPPGAVIAGFLGLALTDIAGVFSNLLQVELQSTMRSIEVNIVNFAFTALVLGFMSSGKGKITPRATVGSILHEGMPMLLYAQALIWGNSCVALAICGIYRLWNKEISKYEGGLVTLGLEAGRDILPSRVKFKEESLAMVHMADSAGLFISVVVGVLLVMFRRVSPNQKQEWFGVGSYGTKEGPPTSREHFSRNVGDVGRVYSLPNLEAAAEAAAGGAEGLEKGEGQGPDTAELLGPTPVERERVTEEEAALGSHIGLIALSVFLGYILNLSFKYIEVNHQFLRNHHLVSGIRLFKVCMVAAAVCMTILRTFTSLRFKSDWFHRIAGFSLDLMVTAALSTLTFDYYKKVPNVELAVVLVLGCVMWNLLAFFTICRRMMPNFWYARGVTLMGDALGHSWVGLLLARTLDPQLQTPVPLAFTYKLLIFFVPGSGGKNSLVISLIDVLGEWPTFLVSLFMIWFWMHVFNRYYKRRWVKDPGRKSTAYGERKHRAGSEDEQEVELLAIGPPKSVEETAGLPRMSAPSVILSKAQIRRLMAVLPETETLKTWSKVFCMSRDGANLGTLLFNAMSNKKLSSFLIIIEDSWGYVFGGYIGFALKNSAKYYGTGEAFVFKFHPDFEQYRWTGKNDFICLSNPQHLAMGGGGQFAFQLDDELDGGVSGPSETFGNPKLSSRGMFRTLNVEVYGFELSTGEVSI